MSAPSHAHRTAARAFEQRETCKTTKEGTSIIGNSSATLVRPTYTRFISLSNRPHQCETCSLCFYRKNVLKKHAIKCLLANQSSGDVETV